MKKLFCFGFGYSCEYLAHDLKNTGQWSFAGTTRSLAKRTKLENMNIETHIFDLEHPLIDPFRILKDVTHVLISTPPNDEGDPAFLIHAEDILSLPSLEWLGYLSTTGVYGDRAGGWVDEDSEIRPTSKRGDRRVKAESQWLSLLKSRDLPVHIFRLAGIYGPGRSALDTVRAGVARRISKPGHAFGRIHVEDIAQILQKSMENPKTGEIYNVCDGNPAPSHEVIEYACELLNRPCPPMIDFEDADLAPITRSFYMDNRRVNSNKIKNDLGITLKYPDYKSGLEACLDAEEYAVTLFNSFKS